MERVEKPVRPEKQSKKEIRHLLNSYGKACGIFGKNTETVKNPEKALRRQRQKSGKMGVFSTKFLWEWAKVFHSGCEQIVV